MLPTIEKPIKKEAKHEENYEGASHQEVREVQQEDRRRRCRNEVQDRRAVGESYRPPSALGASDGKSSASSGHQN